MPTILRPSMSDIPLQNLSSSVDRHDALTAPRLTTSAANLHAVAFTIITRKNLLDTSKIELFNDKNFKHWQEKVFNILDLY